MKKIFKKFSILLLFLICIYSIYKPFTVLAEPKKEIVVNPNQLYEYKWEITNITYKYTTFGEWRIGPTGLGPATLDINSGISINRTYTNSISGSYPIGKSSVELSLGCEIGVSHSYATNYSIQIAEGERKTIIFRPKINVYEIKQTYYRYPVGTIGSPVALDTATCTVYVFQDWDYSWRYGY
ncbi:MAG: hypothetical protein N2448_07925 [Caloramator sp.]|nr:hypothetical protein [Caloramator sp.]